MKKNILPILFIYCSPLFVYAVEDDLALMETSTSDMAGTFFQWIVLIGIPLLVLLTIILGFKHFFKKDREDKKKKPTGIFIMMMKSLIPYSIFAGMFVYSKHQIGGYLCYCFANDYGKITVDTVALIFFVGLILVTYLMKKNNREWKALYTLLTLILFLLAFYSVMAIGEYFYVTDGSTF